MRHSVEELVKEIRAAGTDNLGFFGNGYEREGGMALQQHPDEFAAAVAHLAALFPGDSHSFLEIGSASGGTCRFIAEHVGFSCMNEHLDTDVPATAPGWRPTCSRRTRSPRSR
jgi:hypothetical protein